MMSLNKTALVAFAVGAVGTAAGAQATQCTVDEGKPAQVKDARNDLVKAEILGAKPEEQKKLLAAAIKRLTTAPEAITNVAGRNLMLGRALVKFASLPGIDPSAANRGALGYATSPEGTIDILAAADSAFRAVEQAAPSCVAEVEPYRRTLYIPVIQKAVNTYNAKQLDSAAYYSNRALVIYPSSPIAYNVLANISQSKEDYAGAAAAYRKMVAAIGSDTAFADEKKSAMLNVAEINRALADRATGAEKEALLKAAREDYEAFLKAYPGDAKAQAGLASVQGMAGDTAAVTRTFGTMLEDPSKFTDYQLLTAGVDAARANNSAIAARLFTAGLEKNRFSRDGLYNLAATYSSMDKFDDMIPIVRRLIEVDPSNPDNYQLMALAYQGRAKSLRDAAPKPGAAPAGRGAAGRGNAARPTGAADNPELKAVNDSLLKYFKLYQDLPVKVSFNLFSHEGTKHTLGGTVENRTDAQADYDIKFEFLDASGKVVASQSATIAGVAAKASKPFTVVVEYEGIVAFRYAPVQK